MFDKTRQEHAVEEMIENPTKWQHRAHKRTY